MSRELDQIVKTLIKDTLQYTREDADLARQAAEKLATLDWQQVIMSHRQRELDRKMSVMEDFIKWLEEGGGFCDECPESSYEWGYRRGPQYMRTYIWPHSMTPFRSDASDAQGKRYCWKCFQDKQSDTRDLMLALYREKHPEQTVYMRWPQEMRPCAECKRLVPQKSWYTIPLGAYDHNIYCVYCVATVAERQFVFCHICKKKTANATYGYCYDCYPIQRAYSAQVSAHLARARTAGTPATLTIPEWIGTLEYFNEKCAYCQSLPAQAVEHFIPISQGGGTTAENCVPSCRRCNSRKGDKPIERLIEIFPRHAIERIVNYLKSEKSINRKSRSSSSRALVAL